MSDTRTIAKLTTHVYCDLHGNVHEKNKNPYDAAVPECSSMYWHALYVIAVTDLVKRGIFSP